MPELPEVEAARRLLERFCVGKVKSSGISPVCSSSFICSIAIPKSSAISGVSRPQAATQCASTPMFSLSLLHLEPH